MAQASVHPVSPPHEAEPGIVVFGSSMAVRYSNQRAKELLHRVQWEAAESPMTSDLLHAIVDLGMRVREQWQMRRETSHRADGEARRTVQTDGGPIGLYAFGIQGGGCEGPFHIMVVIDAVGPEHRPDAAPTGTSLQAVW